MTLKALPHQIKTLNWIKAKAKQENIKKVLLALDMGLGKTVISALTFLEGERILVIAPASLKLNWEREIRKWTDVKRIQVIKTKKDILETSPGVTIINYDLLGRKEKKPNVKGSKKKKIIVVPNFDFSGFDRVVVDECHSIKNSDTVRTKITAKIIIKTPAAILLSGTPMERPIDLYAPLYAIGAYKKSKTQFGNAFCDPQMIWIGQRQVWAYRGLSDAEGLQKILKPYMLRMLKEDVLTLPEKNISVIALDLPVSRQEKNYNLADIIKNPEPIGFEGLAELLHEQGKSKIPQAVQHIKMRLEVEDKILVVAKHTEVVDALFDKLKDFNPVLLDGRCSADKKQEAADRFQKDKKCRVLVGQITPLSVGWTLTAARHIVIVEPDWSYSKIAQVIDRLHRIGQKNSVTAELLTIADSICERVLYTTLEKKGFIQEVIGL